MREKGKVKSKRKSKTETIKLSRRRFYIIIMIILAILMFSLFQFVLPMVWDLYQFEHRHGLEHVRVIDEINIPINAKTQMAAGEFTKRYVGHVNKTVYVGGDASGNVESTRDWSTDYVIIKGALKEAGWNVVMQVPKSNPSVNNRINIGCSLMQHRRLLVDPKCHMLINDFERNESDGKGGKNKDDPQQTHASDNFDYQMWRKFSRQFYGTTVRQL